MTLRKRMIAIVIILVMLAGVLYVGIGDQVSRGEESARKSNKQTLRLWYTDEAMTDYLAAVALAFYEDTDIRVLPILTTGLEYLENINEASINSNECPDLFITSNDSLEKAFLAGLASPIKDEKQVVTTSNYSEPAINAVTYKDKIVAYPLSFETSVFLYNKTYMEDFARKTLEATVDLEQGEEAQNIADNSDASTLEAENGVEGASPEPVEITQELVSAKAAQLIPNTIDDIRTFADEYDAPENVEAVFKWDVTDIFFNYFFVGNSINVGGKFGDDPSKIDIYNENALKSLKVYQELNQFFSIEADEVSYDSILQDFIDGKILFTIVTTDAIDKLEDAKRDGTFAYEYGMTTIPNVSSEIVSRSMSVTNAVVVNGYSNQKEEANQLAKYLSYDKVDTMYTKTSKVPARNNISFEIPEIKATQVEYEYSVPIPKMVEASNFWVQLEICFTKVWEGEDANQQLRALSEQLMTQITGEPYSEEMIEEAPQPTQEEEIFIDDEMMTESESTSQSE